MSKCPICKKVKSNDRKFCSFTCRNKYINSRKDYVAQRIQILKTKAIQFPKISFETNCFRCGKNLFIGPIRKAYVKKRYYCSSLCAHKRPQTPETKAKLAASHKQRTLTIEQRIERSNKAVLRTQIFRSRGEKDLLNLLQVDYPQYNFTYGGAIGFEKQIISRDIISKKLLVAIEYDGPWHFREIKNQLKQKQDKDKLYERWIEQSSFRLIRVTSHNFIKQVDLYQELIEAIFNTDQKIIKLYHFDRWSKEEK